MIVFEIDTKRVSYCPHELMSVYSHHIGRNIICNIRIEVILKIKHLVIGLLDRKKKYWCSFFFQFYHLSKNIIFTILLKLILIFNMNQILSNTLKLKIKNNF
jgi:hypothetical protein